MRSKSRKRDRKGGMGDKEMFNVEENLSVK